MWQYSWTSERPKAVFRTPNYANPWDYLEHFLEYVYNAFIASFCLVLGLGVVWCRMQHLHTQTIGEVMHCFGYENQTSFCRYGHRYAEPMYDMLFHKVDITVLLEMVTYALASPHLVK